MPHLVLIGDSIFDNAAYTGGGPDVVSQVRGLLAPGWEATLLAVDGSTTIRLQVSSAACQRRPHTSCSASVATTP